jgi:hypothetical protein
LFHNRDINGETQYQAHTLTSLGSFNEGIRKYWLSDAYALALPVKNALYELTPNGPDAWEVGEDTEAVKAPVTPLVSLKSSPGLNV